MKMNLKWTLRAAGLIIGVAAALLLMPAPGEWNFQIAVTAGLALLAFEALCWTMTSERPLSGPAVFVMLACGGLLVALAKDTMAFPEYGWDEETHRDLLAGLFAAESLPAFLARLRTWDLGYLSSAIGWGIGTAAGLAEEWVRLLGNMTHTICYAAVCALAVRETPRYKTVFAAAAMLPVCLFLSATYTYDTLLISFLLLGTAMLVKLLCGPDKEPVSPAYLMMTAIVWCLGTLPKPAYSVLLFLLFLIPTDRLGGKRKKTAWCVFILVLFGWSLVSLKLPGIYDNVLAGDTRLDNSPDPKAQLAGVLADLPGALGIIGGFFIREIGHWFVSVGAQMGTLTGSRGCSIAALVLLVLSIAAVLPEEEKGAPLKAPRRVMLILLPLLCLFALTVTQYMVSTSVGDNSVSGMQPRYILPVLALLCLGLQLPDQVRKSLRPAGRVLTFAVLGGLMTLTVLLVSGLTFPVYG